jgi:hypothetical protein
MTQTNGRDPKTGQFLVGHTGRGGRPRGSRNKLAEEFIADVYDEWQRSGPECLKKMAATDPASFARMVSNILPAKLEATLTTVDADLFREAKNFAEAFRLARRHVADPDVIELEALPAPVTTDE